MTSIHQIHIIGNKIKTFLNFLLIGVLRFIIAIYIHINNMNFKCITCDRVRTVFHE